MNSRELESTAYKFKMTQIYNLKTNRVEQADYWLSQGEEVIHKLRYSLRKDKKSYGCPFCKTPLILKMGIKTKAHFAHTRRPDGINCAICDENEMPEEDRFWQKYNQAKETDEHIRLKELIGNALLNDPKATDIKIEKNKKGTITPTQWKRPDVQCNYNGKELVFEVQISRTWISDIVEREVFYKTNGAYILWVFNSFNKLAPNQNITQADIFYNNPEINLFVLDGEAEKRIQETGVLNLNCYYKKPQADAKSHEVLDIWENNIIGLPDLQYNSTENKPFFFNYTQEKEKILSVVTARKKEQSRIKQDTEKSNLSTASGLSEFKSNRNLNDPIPHKKEYSPVKIEDKVSKRYSEISDQELVNLLFESHRSKNINNLNNRIADLHIIGFDLPNNLIEILLEKKLIERLTEVTSQVQYGRSAT